MKPIDVDNLFENIGGLTDDEKQFIGNSMTKLPYEMNYLIISEMYSTKHAEKNTKALIISNKKLAESTDKHAKAMRYLTAILVLFTFVLAIVATLTLYFNL